MKRWTHAEACDAYRKAKSFEEAHTVLSEDYDRPLPPEVGPDGLKEGGELNIGLLLGMDETRGRWTAAEAAALWKVIELKRPK